MSVQNFGLILKNKMAPMADCLADLFIWGFTSLSTLCRSYHGRSYHSRKGRGNQYIQFVRVRRLSNFE